VQTFHPSKLFTRIRRQFLELSAKFVELPSGPLKTVIRISEKKSTRFLLVMHHTTPKISQFVHDSGISRYETEAKT